MSSALTAKQQRFVQEYLIDLNGRQAAIRCGYSKHTAEVQASRLLSKANIAAAVKAGQERLAKKAGVTAERIVQEYALLGFCNMADYITGDGPERRIDLSTLTREQAAAITELTVDTYTERDGDDTIPVKRTKFKLADKKGALDSLARHLGMFVDKTEHTGSVNITIRKP